jgi:uncharacterized protein YodC (DUF2158 family)
MAKTATYKTGDIVQLKSGGPTMTVSSVLDSVSAGDSQNVKCQWFSGSKNQEAWFPEDSLEPGKVEEKR